jgi:hypothetical protein
MQQTTGILQIEKTDFAPRGNLFVCGWNTTAERIFPDYHFQGPWNPQIHRSNSTRNDILVIGMYGKGCPGSSSSRPQQLLYEFPGKVLFVRAEPKYWTLQSTMSNHFHPKFYQLGTFEYDIRHAREVDFPNLLTTRWDKRTLQVFYLVFVLLGQTYETERWHWITDPNQRRKNTGKYNGMAYFAKNCVPFRQEAAMNISTIAGIPIFYGEGCSVESASNFKLNGHSRSNYTQNYNLFHDFRYCLVMENTAMDGYITEKILNAFLAGCLPVYSGTRQVFDIFHSDSFVFYDINHPEPALHQLTRLNTNPKLYDRMIRAPILKHENVVDDYFSLFPDVGNGKVNRQLRRMMFLPLFNADGASGQRS